MGLRSTRWATPRRHGSQKSGGRLPVGWRAGITQLTSSKPPARFYLLGSLKDPFPGLDDG